MRLGEAAAAAAAEELAERIERERTLRRGAPPTEQELVEAAGPSYNHCLAYQRENLIHMERTQRTQMFLLGKMGEFERMCLAMKEEMHATHMIAEEKRIAAAWKGVEDEKERLMKREEDLATSIIEWRTKVKEREMKLKSWERSL